MRITIVCVLLIILFTKCVEAQSNKEAVLEKVFPGKEWLTTEPENVGYSSKKLERAREKFEEIEGAAALVIVKGYIIADWGLTDLNFGCRSIRKSMLSSLYGTELENGTISLENTLGELGIDEKGTLTKSELNAQIKHLMTTSSGVYLPGAFEEATHRNKPERGTHSPGQQFSYNNWDFNALGTIYNQSTNSDLFEAFSEKIATPLQMEHFDGNYNTAYVYQPSLSKHPAYLFRISTKDLARFGLLYLNEGNWNGEQIVPKDWVLNSTSSQIKTGEDYFYNYGYLWWVSKRESNGRAPFLARGAQSQYMYIDAANDLIVIFRDNPDGIKQVKKSDAYPLIGAVYGAMIR